MAKNIIKNTYFLLEGFEEEFRKRDSPSLWWSPRFLWSRDVVAPQGLAGNPRPCRKTKGIDAFVEPHLSAKAIKDTLGVPDMAWRR